MVPDPLPLFAVLVLADPATSFSFAFASGGPTTAPAKSTDDPVAAANKTVDGMAAKIEMAILFPNVVVSFGPLCCGEEDEDDEDDELARDAWTVLLLALPRIIDLLTPPKNPSDDPPERKGVADEDDIFLCS